MLKKQTVILYAFKKFRIYTKICCSTHKKCTIITIVLRTFNVRKMRGWIKSNEMNGLAPW